MRLVQEKDLGDGSEEELFLAQWESAAFMGESTLAAITDSDEKKPADPPLDEYSCNAAKSATRRWWEVWYDWEDGKCLCWGWNKENNKEQWFEVTKERHSRSKKD